MVNSPGPYYIWFWGMVVSFLQEETRVLLLSEEHNNVNIMFIRMYANGQNCLMSTNGQNWHHQMSTDNV